MFPIRPHIEIRTGHAGTGELPNSTGHGSGTIAPVSVMSPADRGLSRFPAGAGPSTAAGGVGALRHRHQAGASGRAAPYASGTSAGTSAAHRRQSATVPAPMPQDLQHIKSALGLNLQNDWDELRQFVENRLHAQPAPRQASASQAPSTSQSLDQIKRQAGLHSPDDWAALEKFVRDELNAAEHIPASAVPNAPSAAKSGAGASSGALSVTPTTTAQPNIHPARMILEAAAKQPGSGPGSINLANKKPLPFLHETHAAFGPGRTQLTEYVQSFLKQYGYKVEIKSGNANQGLLHAINPDSGQEFFVYAKTCGSNFTARPVELFAPPGIPNIIAGVHNNPAQPSLMGRVYLIPI